MKHRSHYLILSLVLLVQFSRAQNYALSFDGVDDYVDMGIEFFSLDLGTGDDCNYTISVTVNVGDLSNDPVLLGNSNLISGLYLQANSSGQVVLKIGEHSVVSPGEIIFENTWHHIIVNTDCYYNNRLWVDGVEYDIEDTNIDLGAPGRNLHLGTSNGLDDTGQEYNGRMDELSIFHS